MSPFSSFFSEIYKTKDLHLVTNFEIYKLWLIILMLQLDLFNFNLIGKLKTYLFICENPQLKYVCYQAKFVIKFGFQLNQFSTKSHNFLLLFFWLNDTIYSYITLFFSSHLLIDTKLIHLDCEQCYNKDECEYICHICTQSSSSTY